MSVSTLGADTPNTVTLGGKAYLFELTYATHRRILSMTGVSLPDCVSGISGIKTKEQVAESIAGYNQLMQSFDKLVGVIHAFIAPQLTANGVSDDDFFAVLDGAFAVAGAKAVTRALIDFFHGDARGKLLAGAVEMQARAAKVQEATTKQAMASMDRHLTKMETMMTGAKGADVADAMTREILTNSLKTLPESVVSILTPILCGQ